MLIKERKNQRTSEENNSKFSFPAISNTNTEILILGTLPGDRSIQTQEYFAHPRNRFWKIIAALTDNDVPEDYEEKRNLLLDNKIGVWNVLKKAERKGSLDAAIRNAVPNDLSAFMAKHEKLKIVGFDGLKVEALYDKHFQRRSDLIYYTLASCSPANARFNLEALCRNWERLLEFRRSGR